MKQLPLASRIYVATVILAGTALAAVCLPPFETIDQPILLIALMVLSSATAAVKVALPFTTLGSTMSVSYAVDFASLLLLGPHQTMLVAACSACSQSLFYRKDRAPVHQTLFNMAAIVLTVQGAGLALRLLGDPGMRGTALQLAPPIVGAAAAYFLLNTGLVATAIALASGERPTAVWQANFLWGAPIYVVGSAAAALAAALVVHAGYWVAPLGFAPLYLTYRTFKVYTKRIEDEERHVLQTSNLHLATVEALARAIDAKDQTARMHIRRVQVYAAHLAKAAGLSEPEIQGVRTAALLHDIGKLAVPEHILSKPGPLTQEEFQKIRIHPQVGAEIIAKVPFPYPVAPLILSHHERWDGKGYPQGLKGQQIPVGARILTIVDYFDAVTTERPYHKALNYESAIGLLKHEMGRAFDPDLAATFIDMLPFLVAETAAEGCAEEHLATAEPIAAFRKTASGLPAGAGHTAFENITLAHREIYSLYEIAQSMGTSLGVPDTMALISAKLTKIVPWSGCSLFLQQPDSDLLKCRFAAGVDTPQLLNLTVKVGEGLDGAVAKHRHTLVNAIPSTSFLAAGLADTQLQSAMVCPLYGDGTFIGCLAVYHVDPERYTEDHRRLLERIAEQAGSVLHNAIVFEQTQEDSLTDPLTGLPNRRSMFVHLSREMARAERLKGEVAVIVMDVDNFKAINDTYGHNVGDHALRHVARALHGALRSYDLCVRYAGDEFIIIVADCSGEAAELKRRELQQRVAAIELEARPGKLLRLAASAGAAVFPHDGLTYEALLASADHSMYRDKAARRGHAAAPRTQEPTGFNATELYDTTPPGTSAAETHALL